MCLAHISLPVLSNHITLLVNWLTFFDLVERLERLYISQLLIVYCCIIYVCMCVMVLYVQLEMYK